MTPTKEMKAFLAELADLMEKHGVTTLEVMEAAVGYYNEVEGIEVEIDGQWDDDCNPTREYCSVNIGRYVDRGVLRDLATKD